MRWVALVGDSLPVLALAAAAVFSPSNLTPELEDGLARTPPMGWNDWNAFGCDVSEELVEQTADAMVANGMRAAGYEYVNIDDCWLARERDAAGNLVPDPVKFPNGIAAVARSTRCPNRWSATPPSSCWRACPCRSRSTTVHRCTSNSR